MPFRTMSIRPLQTAARFILFIAPTLLLAQEISSSEELRLEALARAQAEIYIPRNNVSVGFRMLSSGAKVHFGNLGNVPFANAPIALSAGMVNRTYDNGYVDTDAPRANEVDQDGVQTSTPGGRYTVTGTVTTNVTDANGNIVGTIDSTQVASDSLSYTPGLTRVWSYNLPSQAQLRPGYIAMSSYSATSDGSAFDKKQGPTGGLELQFARTLGKSPGRTQWSLLTGISINDINSKSTRDFTATLHTSTDFYSLNGLAAPDASLGSPYVAPYIPDLITEATTPLAALPADHTDSAIVGGATVRGQYQIKGAYFLIKLGPAVHFQLSERFGISASAGVAGGYSGTRYLATEVLDVPEMGTTITNTTTSDMSKLVAGYYGDFTVDFAANEVTSLYAGVTTQKVGAYDQTLDTRTAKIDISGTVGLRGGISVRF